MRIYFFNVVMNWLIALTIVFATKGSLQAGREQEKQTVLT
jgi:hypothetical protein